MRIIVGQWDSRQGKRAACLSLVVEVREETRNGPMCQGEPKPLHILTQICMTMLFPPPGRLCSRLGDRSVKSLQCRLLEKTQGQSGWERAVTECPHPGGQNVPEPGWLCCVGNLRQVCLTASGLDLDKQQQEEPRVEPETRERPKKSQEDSSQEDGDQEDGDQAPMGKDSLFPQVVCVPWLCKKSLSVTLTGKTVKWHENISFPRASGKLAALAGNLSFPGRLPVQAPGLPGQCAVRG